MRYNGIPASGTLSEKILADIQNTSIDALVSAIEN